MYVQCLYIYMFIYSQYVCMSDDVQLLHRIYFYMTSVLVNQTNRYILFSLNTDDINYANKTLSLCMVYLQCIYVWIVKILCLSKSSLLSCDFIFYGIYKVWMLRYCRRATLTSRHYPPATIHILSPALTTYSPCPFRCQCLMPPL